MHRTVALVALLLVAACGRSATPSSGDCSGFEETAHRLEVERTVAESALERTGSQSDRDRAETAGRTYAEFYLQGDVCATTEDRARAKADLAKWAG